MNHKIEERFEELDRDLRIAEANGERDLADKIMGEIEELVIQVYYPEMNTDEED